MTWDMWRPEQDNRRRKVLGKIIEELGELQAIAARCLIQGVDASHPETGKANLEALGEELADAIAVIDIGVMEFLPENIKVLMDRKHDKKKRLYEWIKDEATNT